MSKVAESCLRRMMADNSYVCFFCFCFLFLFGFFIFYLILMSSAQF